MEITEIILLTDQTGKIFAYIVMKTNIAEDCWGITSLPIKDNELPPFLMLNES